MNSIGFLRKTIIASCFTRRSAVRPQLYEYYVTKYSTASNILDSGHEIQESTSNVNVKRETDHCTEESDQFGTLRTPLEDRVKFKFNSPKYSASHRSKKIIKIKKLPPPDQGDVFGTLSEKNAMWYPDINEESKKDNDLSDDSVTIKNISKKFRCPRKYLSEMKRLVNEKKVKAALELFVDMKRNFVSPILPHYTYMIGVCGRIGYTEMAFKLLRQMTDRSLKPTPATLTGLFNACAESPFPEYGLKKARLLKEKIEEKSWQINQVTYHAMIKAFGKCGDLITAFKIVDEMAKADIKISADTYNFLLISCIAKKDAGFTYAVEVWRKMKAKRCPPNIYSCNLLLTAARDCGVGPEEISSLLLQHWSSYSKRPYGFITNESLKQLEEKPILKLQSGTEINSEELDNKCHTTGSKTENTSKSCDRNEISSNKKEIPSHELQNVQHKSIISKDSRASTLSLLSSRPVNGPEILELVNIKTRSDRLNLVGGMEGFLDFMKREKIKPDKITFDVLLECLPDSTTEEEKLLSIIDSYQMKPKIGFFNILIKRRNFRKETEKAREVLYLLNKYELTPDIMTFGALTLGCRTLNMATTLISEMKKFGASPNIEIVGSMARQACMILDFTYMKYVLKLMEEEEIRPDQRLLSNMEKTLSAARKNIILMEQGKEVDDFYRKRKTLSDDFRNFLIFYENWLKRMKFQPEEHPWSQYKTDIIDRTAKEQLNV